MSFTCFLVVPAWILLVVLGGCSSAHNLKTDGHNPLGGGFTDDELRPGLFRMTAVGNLAPWPNFSAARATWQGRADQLCGPNAYREIGTQAWAANRGEAAVYVRPGSMVGLPRFNAVMTGFVLCNSSSLSYDDAVTYIEDLPGRQAREFAAGQEKELAELGGRACAAGASAETYFRRGKVLTARSEYVAAMNCYLRAQEGGRDSARYRDSCEAIGTMYELGWGVEKNPSRAHEWFDKAAR